MIPEYGTRHHRDLQILKVRLEYAKRSVYFSCVENWNDIPDSKRVQETLAGFKKRVRMFLLTVQGLNKNQAVLQFHSILFTLIFSYILLICYVY